MLEEAIFMPFYDRTMVKDPNKIGSLFWQHKQKIKFEGYRQLLPHQQQPGYIFTKSSRSSMAKKNGYGSMSNAITSLKFYSNKCLHMGLHCQSPGLDW